MKLIIENGLVTVETDEVAITAPVEKTKITFRNHLNAPVTITSAAKPRPSQYTPEGFSEKTRKLGHPPSMAPNKAKLAIELLRDGRLSYAQIAKQVGAEFWQVQRCAILNKLTYRARGIG